MPDVVPEGQLHAEERETIRRFARGERTLRGAAIEAFHAFLARHRHRPKEAWPVEILFMSEIDNPSPDLALRAAYRKRLQEETR